MLTEIAPYSLIPLTNSQILDLENRCGKAQNNHYW